MVDIDGVISLFGFEPERPPAGDFHAVDGILHLLSAGAGARLRRLDAAFELVWCSGWEERANEHLPWALGLTRPLPYLRFEPTAGHWKLPAIDAYAGPARPLAWVDDALDARCHAWATDRPGPTLLITTDPAVGLRDTHVDELLAWASDGQASPPCPDQGPDRTI